MIASGRATPFFEESYAGVDGVIRHWLTSKVPLTSGTGSVWGVATVAVPQALTTRPIAVDVETRGE